MIKTLFQYSLLLVFLGHGFMINAQQPFERAVLIASELKGDSITFSWNEDLTATDYTIFKRNLDESTWGSPIAILSPSAVTFTDYLAPGDAKSYAIFKSNPAPYLDTIQAKADNYQIVLEDQFAKGLCCNFGIGYFLLRNQSDTLVFANDFESLFEDSFSLDQDADLILEIQPDLFGNHLGWELTQTSNDSIISEFGPLGTYLRKAPSLGMISVGNKYSGTLDQSTSLILVASNLYADLEAELNIMSADLEAEGKHAIVLEVPMEMSVDEVKTLIVTQQNMIGNLSSLFIIGHVAVPYSGDMYPDTHSEHHKGAWASDPFYADLDGIYTDNVVNETSAFFDKTKNVPGDGKYDQSLMPSALELIIGRADFSDLPGLSTDELTLTKNYLTKVHNWKMGNIKAIPQGLVDDNFGRAFGAPASNGYRNLASLLGPEQVTDKDFLTALTDSSHLWAYGCGSGTTFSSEGVATTLDFEEDSLQAIFLMTFGSNFGDWDHENNFLRAPLASGTVLNNAWVGNPHWFMHQMGVGVPIGKVAWKNMNSHYLPGPQSLHMALMGDPSVTQYPIGSIDSIKITYDNDGPVIKWKIDSSKSYERYALYHRTDSTSAWDYLINIDGADSSYLHKDAIEGFNQYFLFPEKLINNNSGCFFQKGLGVQDTVNFEIVLDEYKEFLLGESEWFMKKIVPPFVITEDGANWKYSIVGDTLLNDLTYRKLYLSNLCEWTIDDNKNRIYNYEINLNQQLVGALRQEGKQVYFYHFEDLNEDDFLGDLNNLEENQEYLLYDYDFSLGDTLMHETGAYTVIVDTTEAIKGYRGYSIIHSDAVNFPGLGKLMEGIGSSHGLFGPLYSGQNALACFKLSGVPFIEEDCEICQGFMVATGQVLDAPAFNLFPNPAGEQISIELSSDGLIRLQVLNTHGNIVKQNLTNSIDFEMDISELSAGIYFLRVIDKKGASSVQRFVKLN